MNCCPPRRNSSAFTSPGSGFVLHHDLCSDIFERRVQRGEEEKKEDRRKEGRTEREDRRLHTIRALTNGRTGVSVRRQSSSCVRSCVCQRTVFVHEPRRLVRRSSILFDERASRADSVEESRSRGRRFRLSLVMKISQACKHYGVRVWSRSGHSFESFYCETITASSL